MPVINVWTTVSTCFIIMDHSTSRYFLNKWTYSRNDRSFTTVKYKHALIIEWLKFIVAQFWWKSLEHLHLQWSVKTQGLHSSMLFFSVGFLVGGGISRFQNNPVGEYPWSSALEGPKPDIYIPSKGKDNQSCLYHCKFFSLLFIDIVNCNLIIFNYFSYLLNHNKRIMIIAQC